METVTENQTSKSKLNFSTFRLSRKALDWTYELLPESRKFLAIEFDRNLVKFVLVDGRGVMEGVRYLKVKFLSSESDEEIRKVLRENLQEMGLKRGHRVTISIPRHSVHAKILRLPSHDTEELRKMAFYHLQKDIPLAFQEVVYDVRLIAREPDGYARIMVVMARKQAIKRYMKLCQSEGLVVDAIRLNIEAIYQSFLQFLEDLPAIDSKCMALVDVDFSATNVIIIDRGKFLFCRSVGKGVEDLMERMVGPHRSMVYDTWIDELSKGISDTIAIFEANSTDPPVEYIALTGWLPRVQNLTQKLMENLNVPVSWFDLMIPLGHFTETSTETAQHHWFSISTLLGMAGARDQNLMDLRPVEERQNRRRRDLIRQSIYTGLLLIYLLALVLGTAKFALHRRHLAVTNLEEKIVALRPQVEIVNKWQKLQQSLENQLGSTELTCALIAQLLEKLPSGVEISSLTFSRGERLLLRGVARDLASVFNLPQMLVQQPAFGEAVITSADRRQRPGKREEIEFEMKINLQLNEN
ncbi:MAG: pilus assembly protein PilM [bacterium]